MATTDSQSTYELLTEDLIPPADGVEELTGSRPAPATCWRWIAKGLQGHKLESVRVLGKTYTSKPAIRRWLAAVEAARTAERSEQTDERSEHVKLQLADAGLLR
jgi:hypothetical protein